MRRFSIALLTVVMLLAFPLGATASRISTVIDGVTLIVEVAGLLIDLNTAFPGLASEHAPTSLKIDFVPTLDDVTLNLNSSPILNDFTKTFDGVISGPVPIAGGGTAIADLWQYRLDLTLKNRVDIQVGSPPQPVNEDQIILNGFIQHIIERHTGEPQKADELHFQASVNGSSKGGTANTHITAKDPSVPKSTLHAAPGQVPPHRDFLDNAFLDASMVFTPGGVFTDPNYDFDSFHFTAHAMHVPEIDAGSAVTALGVLSGVIALTAERLRRKEAN